MSHDGRGSRLWLATFGLAAVVVLFGASVRAYLSAARWMDHTLEVRATIDAWLHEVRTVESSARRFLETAEPADRAAFTSAAERARRAAARFNSLVVDNERQRLAGAQTARDAELVIGHYGSLLDRASGPRPGGAGSRVIVGEVEQKLLTDRFEQDCFAMQREEARLLDERRARIKERVLLATAGGSALGAMAFGFLLAAWVSHAQRERLLATTADAAEARLRSLSAVAVALSEVRTKSEVAVVVVDVIMRALGADTATLHLLDARGTTLELIGQRGVAPEIVEKIRRISSETNSVTFATLTSGEALFAETEADYKKLLPNIQRMPAEGPRAKSFFSIPLVVEGRPVGLLGMGFYRAHRFSPEDRVLIDTMSKHCGQALARAVRLESEDEARRWLTTTLRSIGDAVIATDARGLITFMNPVAEKLTGFTEAESRCQPLEQVFRIFSEETRAVVENPVARILREGAVIGLANHTILRSRTGEERPIDDSGAPIRSEAGEIVGVVLVFRDVSRDKAERARRDFLAQAGEALVSSLDYAQTLATVTRLAVPAIADWCAVHILDAKTGTPYQAAVAHADPLKLELARVLGERYPADPSAPHGAPAVISSGKSELYEQIPPTLLEASARSPEHLALIRELDLHSAMVVPLRAREHVLGAVTFVYAESQRHYGSDDLAFAEDFARRAAMAIENALALRQVDQARAQERRLRADAEVASRAKDDFLAMVSHELRTPLNAILGWSVILRTPGNQEKFERGLAVIERNARAQAKLIEDVLDVSRIISGKLALSLGPTSIAEAISASIETVAPAAEAKEISVEATLPTEPVTITADAQRVQQIVWNLLSNAVKFTPKGGKVRIAATREGTEVRIVVRDTGEGIRPELLDSVFAPFQQADTSTTRRHGGLGLGLAIVRQLVVAHGGTVHAESEGLGCGATFVVALPARAASSSGPRQLPTGHLSSTPPPPASGERALAGLVVLVVDDEEDALQLESRVLSAHGAEVHTAASAREAFAKVASIRPDVLVSDIGMPEEDGYTLIRKVRSLPPEQGGHTLAVALTAYARREDAQRAFAAGYQRHVAKPIEPVELANVVANLRSGDSRPPDV